MLPDQVRKDVLVLMQDERFVRLLGYWRSRDDMIVETILQPMTAPSERDVMVKVRDILRREVICLPELARKQDERVTGKE